MSNTTDNVGTFLDPPKYSDIYRCKSTSQIYTPSAPGFIEQPESALYSAYSENDLVVPNPKLHERILLAPQILTVTSPSGGLVIPGQQVASNLPILDQVCSSLPSVIYVSDTNAKEQKSFFIRDVESNLIFKADLQASRNRDARGIPISHVITWKSLMDVPFLNIDIGIVPTDPLEERICKIIHHDTPLGCLVLKENPETFQIKNFFENREYFIIIVDSWNVKIARNYYSTPIAEIYLEELPFFPPTTEPKENELPKWYAFRTKITFKDLTITTVEQCFILGLAMAMMKVRKETRMKLVDDHEDNIHCRNCCFVFFAVFLLCILIWAFAKAN